jgi:hypothetical protein
MKSPFSWRLVGSLTLACTLPLCLLAAPPAWWAERGVIAPNKEANDFSPINQGQLKQIALAAFEELEAQAFVGAGAAVTQQIGAWTQLDANNHRIPKVSAQTLDYAPVNMGQLKAMAKPFYDRLIAVGYTTGYPWTDSPTPANDYAVANIGQVKNLFRFDFTKNSDSDGLPDWWETRYGLDPQNANGIQGGSGDFDGDGVSNLEEFLQRRNPTKGAVADTTGLVNLEVYTP